MVNTPWWTRFEWRALVMCDLCTCFEEAYLFVNKQKCLCTKCPFIEDVDALSTDPSNLYCDVVRLLCAYTRPSPLCAAVHLRCFELELRFIIGTISYLKILCTGCVLSPCTMCT